MRKFYVVLTFPAFVGFTGNATKSFAIEAENESEALKKVNEKHNRFNRAIKCTVEELA